MLEKYEKNFDEKEFVSSFMSSRGITTKREAIKQLRKLIKPEPYYQSAIKKALKKKYPDAFVCKIAQAIYSQGGIPDILMIYKGHYFGFEVKRPVLGVPSPLQEQTIRLIKEAGGTGAFVIWPEQAIEEVEKYEKRKGEVPD